MENNYLPEFVMKAYKDRIQEIIKSNPADVEAEMEPVLTELKKINNDMIPQEIIDMIPVKEEVVEAVPVRTGPMGFSQLASYLTTDDFSWIKVKHLNFPELKDKAYSELLEHHVKETEFLINKVREIAQDYHDFKMKKMRE